MINIQSEPLRSPGRVARIGGLKNLCIGTIGDRFALDCQHPAEDASPSGAKVGFAAGLRRRR